MIPNNSPSNQVLPFVNDGADTENNNNKIGSDFNNQEQQINLDMNWSFWNFGEEDYTFLTYCLNYTFIRTINLDHI